MAWLLFRDLPIQVRHTRTSQVHLLVLLTDVASIAQTVSQSVLHHSLIIRLDGKHKFDMSSPHWTSYISDETYVLEPEFHNPQEAKQAVVIERATGNLQLTGKWHDRMFGTRTLAAVNEVINTEAPSLRQFPKQYFAWKHLNDLWYLGIYSAPCWSVYLIE